jgi:hypothetical protein
MRTTLDIEDDVLQAAKELAQHDGITTGQVLSALARKGLRADSSNPNPPVVRNGVPLLPSGGEIITLEHVKKLMDEEGI